MSNDTQTTDTTDTDRAEQIKAEKRRKAALKGAATRRRNAAKKAAEQAAAESTTAVTPTVPNRAIPSAPKGDSNPDKFRPELEGKLTEMRAHRDAVLPTLDEGKQKWLSGILDSDDDVIEPKRAADIRAASGIFRAVRERIALEAEVAEVANHEDAAGLQLWIAEELGKATADPNYLANPKARQNVRKAVRVGRQQLAVIADSFTIRVGVSWAESYLNDGWSGTVNGWMLQEIEKAVAMSDDQLNSYLHSAGKRKSLALALKALFDGMVRSLDRRGMSQSDADWVAELKPMVANLQGVIDAAQVAIDAQKARREAEQAKQPEAAVTE